MKRKLMRAVFAAMMAATSVIFIAGCGGGDGGDPANVAGTWSGPATQTYQGNSESYTMISVLTQNGGNVNGTMNGEPVSGVVDGNSVALAGSSSGYTYAFEMTCDGNSMSGTYVVTGSFDGEVNGTVNLTRVVTGG